MSRIKQKHRVLIVDDEEDVHTITRMSLRKLRYRERGLEFLSAFTGREAVEIMRRESGVAVILLDVVMESDHAGLKACRRIREELANPFVRILLRTGQAGAAPERKVIEEYDIDGYLEKAELTSTRLYSAVRTSLKAFGELMDLETIVAARTEEIQRHKTENERLLLSILPASIAERVRSGELRSRFEALHETFAARIELDPHALVAYVPMDRRHALAAGEELPERMDGAALFADVSGFTPLTEALTRELGSRRGAEELTRQLNRVYGALLGEVHRYRGSVIGFSGDAVTCWFDGDDGRRAVACALNMQRVMGWFAAIETPSGSLLPLAIKVAITRGPIRRLLVGDPEVQVLELVTGTTLDRLETVREMARQGEVVVGPRVIEALGDRIRLAVRGRDHPEGRPGVVAGLHQRVDEEPWLPLFEPPPENEIRKWVLPAACARLLSGQGPYLAELRTAVALFLGFEGVDAEDSDAGARLDSWVRWVQRVLTRTGGALIQLTTGDKGTYLYAAFGAPVAYEDAADRALAAALELRSLPAEMEPLGDVRIGLSLGRMRVGEYGSEIRRTYGVLGDETNVAARLMGKAKPGQILASGRVADASTHYRFEDLGTVTVTGRRQPLRICEVAGFADFPDPSDDSALVGRMVEGEALAEIVASLHRKEENGVVLVEGEAGIGKSRLLRDVLGRVDESIDVRFGYGMALEQRRALQAWRGILHGLHDSGDVDTAPAKTVPTKAAVTALRRAAAERPLLLVFDDAQWLDPESWDLLERARREVEPLAILAAFRPLLEPFAEGYLKLQADPAVRRVALEPLEPEESLELACRHLDVDRLPESVADFLRERAGGHPRFCRELAAELRDRGLLLIDGRECRAVGDLALEEIPEPIERSVTSSIDALEPAEQLVLKVAAVVGHEVTLDALHGVFPVATTEERLRDSLNLLERLRFLILGSGPVPVYRFRHPFVREVAYGRMLHSQRRQLHQSVADWIERRHAEDREPMLPRLADHWWRALRDLDPAEPRLVTRAVDHLELAGKQALRQGEHAIAIRRLRRGLELLQQLPHSIERSFRELELRVPLGSALAAAGAVDDDATARNQARVEELNQVIEQSGRVPVSFLRKRIAE